MQLAQVRLVTEDFGAMFRFYRDVLGLLPQVDDDRGPYGKLSLPAGDAAIALQSREHLQQTVPGLSRGAPDRVVLALKVTDIDATVATLSARGAVFTGPPSVQWGRLKVAYLRDPEGNLIELQQWLG